MPIFYFGEEFGQCRAEMIEPGHIEIFREDNLLGEIKISIYKPSVTYTTTDQKYNGLFDTLTHSIQDRLDHPGQWFDSTINLWRNYNDIYSTD